MSIQKMSLHDALARVGNPRLRRGGAKLSASARDLIDAGLGRASNPKKKKKSTKKAKSAYKAKVKASAKKSKSKSKSKSKKKGGRPRAGSAEAREMMARVRAGMSPTGGKKKSKSKKKSKKSKSKSSRAKNPSARVRAAHAKHALEGRADNGKGKTRRVRHHRAHARRHHNPAFDVKGLLIQTGLVIAGAFVAAKLIPLVATGLSKVGMFKGEGAKNIGYAHILGAVAVAAAGDFLNSRYGSKIGFDVQPATIAIAAIMAYDGLQRANIVDDVALTAPVAGTFALTGQASPALGSIALTGRAPNPSFALTGPAMSGALVLPGLNDPNAMLGTDAYGYDDYDYSYDGDDYGTSDMNGSYHDYGMGATVLANLPETNAMLGSIFDDSDSMHGTVFTAAELPVPSVAPHSVMQSSQVTVPQMC
jgi:hypothetical protein